jgi:hypothetical protein
LSSTNAYFATEHNQRPEKLFRERFLVITPEILGDTPLKTIRVLCVTVVNFPLMLEKPAIPDELILSRLQDEYHLHNAQLTFLPLGADLNTAVYRVVTDAKTAYFLKLRKGFKKSR